VTMPLNWAVTDNVAGTGSQTLEYNLVAFVGNSGTAATVALFSPRLSLMFVPN